jgi:hypothetical protein
MNNFEDTVPGLKISNICMQSFPCQHHVIMDDTELIMFGQEIYQYCIDHNCPVPEHFAYCKTIIEKKHFNNLIESNNLEEFKNNELMENDYNKTEFLKKAIQMNKINFIKYLVEEKDALVTYECLVECTKSSNLLNIFKYLLDNSNIDVNHSGMHYIGHGGNNLLSLASYHNNLPLVKYLIEERNVSLTQPDNQTKPLIEAYHNQNGGMSEMVGYLVNKSIENHVVYYGKDIQVIKKMGLYDVFLEHNMIYNANGKSDVQVVYDGSGYVDGAELFFGKNQFIYELENIIYTNLHNHANIVCCLPVTKCAIKSIDIAIDANMDNVITDCLLNFGGSEISLKKTINGNTLHFSFVPLNPISYIQAVFTSKQLKFKIANQLSDNLFIKDLTVKIVFTEDKFANETNIISIKIDDKTEYKISCGTAIFVDLTELEEEIKEMNEIMEEENLEPSDDNIESFVITI